MAPSDQVNIGVIGLNGMGWSNPRAALKVPVCKPVALCDIDKNVIDKRLGELAKMNVNTGAIKPLPITVPCWTWKRWMPWSLPHPTTGIVCKWCMPAGLVKIFMWRNPWVIHWGMQDHDAGTAALQPRGAGWSMAAQPAAFQGGTVSSVPVGWAISVR